MLAQRAASESPRWTGAVGDHHARGRETTSELGRRIKLKCSLHPCTLTKKLSYHRVGRDDSQALSKR